MTARTYHARREDPILVDAVEPGGDVRDGAARALLGTAINLSTAGLETYFYTGWHPELVDLMVIAGAVEYCDLSVRRPRWGWARSFDLRVAVHDLSRWENEAVALALEEALTFLTGDAWAVSFSQREREIAQVGQGTLGFDVRDRIIMPYSDGIDSRAVASLVDFEEDGGLVRVRLGTKGADSRSRDPRERRFMSVPYQVKLEARQRVESTARSRGFKFAVITGVAACLANVKRIVVTESGQGALGPILATLGQAYPDYRVHPAFTRRVEALLMALTGKQIRYEYPRIWSTKGETVKAASALPSPPNWSSTRSCWQNSRQVSFAHQRRQCGICAACMLRRLSMHAAGVDEPASNYIWENLSAPDIASGTVHGFTLMTKALEEHAIAGVLHLDHLAALAGSEIHRRTVDRVARETAQALSIEPVDAERKMHDLLTRHREEWLRFQSNLGPNSFVSQLARVSPWPQ
ncbi:Queuosine biosynthesis protein QueC [Sphingobium sp. AP50]|uniref:7-cyano-7-deazaguanine synthase n=1 Tax=Sphingobium sp. AP50 TaxID=1884369 RepID=UPI0008BD9B4E|nr:7-cyano-7-deazaguanine synthase [Sphingobium sp. AP50]SEJ83382.1 Queuosine biosynthesis protein QueC [Sphingobium sp. AP50]